MMLTIACVLGVGTALHLLWKLARYVDDINRIFGPPDERED